MFKPENSVRNDLNERILLMLFGNRITHRDTTFSCENRSIDDSRYSFFVIVRNLILT